MTRSLRVLYISLFLVLLLALGAWSLRSFFGFSTNADATVLNGRWTKAVETHYDDEFPIKRLGTNLWAALDYKLFNEGRPGVVLGRDHWLYSDEEFNPAVNEDQNLQGNYALVEGVRQKLKAQGIQLVMAIVPAKVRLYPEHLGEVKPASIHANLYQDFHARVAADNIPAPDLLGPLQQAKLAGKQVFLRTDTHWTPDGAEVAAKQLAKAIADKTPLSGEPQRFVTEAEKTEPHKGDLRLFLPLDPLFENLMPPKEPLEKRVTHLAEEKVMTRCSATAKPRWHWSAPATAPTPTGTSSVRSSKPCTATWSATPKTAMARSCRCSAISKVMTSRKARPRC